METDVSEELPGWEQIQSPFSAVTAELMISSNDDDNPVAIKDDFYGEASAFFPPGNQEELPINSTLPQDNDNHESESESKPMDRESKRLHFGAVTQSSILHIADRFRKFFTCDKVGYSWFAWAAVGGVASVLLVLCLFRRRFLTWRQKRTQLKSRNTSLMLVVREKDKKINELLLQIAQMNEVLLARRRVPVIHVK